MVNGERAMNMMNVSKNHQWMIVSPLSYLTIKPLDATLVVFNAFYQPFKSQSLGMKFVFKHQDLQMF